MNNVASDYPPPPPPLTYTTYSCRLSPVHATRNARNAHSKCIHDSKATLPSRLDKVRLEFSEFLIHNWFGGVVVITSALHAEGLGFEPRPNLDFFSL